jgi:hypothetical protein
VNARQITLIVNCSLLQLSDFLEPENYYFEKALDTNNNVLLSESILNKLVDWTSSSDVNLNESSRKEVCKFGL